MPNHPATPPLFPCTVCGRTVRPQRTPPIPGIDTVAYGAKDTCARCYMAQRRAEGYVPPARRRRQEERAQRRKELEERLAAAPELPKPEPLTDDTPGLTTLLTSAADLAWQADAICAQTDAEAFFPEKGGSTREAKQVCAACPVREQCLQYALDNDERFGVWGGLSERQRRALKKRSAA